MFRGYMRRSVRGFTLVELLMALFVFSLLLAMAFRSVGVLSEIQPELEESQGELMYLQKAVGMLSRDVSQSIALHLTPVANPMLDSPSTETFLFSFGNAENRRFAYVFSDGILSRHVVSEEVTGQRIKLLDGLGSVSFEPVEVKENYGKRWFELTLGHKKFGDVSRLVSNAHLPSRLLMGEDSFATAGATNQTGGPQVILNSLEGGIKETDESTLDW